MHLTDHRFFLWLFLKKCGLILQESRCTVIESLVNKYTLLSTKCKRYSGYLIIYVISFIVLQENGLLSSFCSRNRIYTDSEFSVKEWWRRWPFISRVSCSSPSAGDFLLQQWLVDCCPSISLKKGFGQ